MNSSKADLEAVMLAATLGRRPQQAPVQREQVIKDLLGYLAKTPLSDEEAEALFTVIAKRVRNATCSQCLKQKAKFEGEVRDKKFICRDCKFLI